MKYERGNVIEWWSDSSPRTKAIFVAYDVDMPTQYCILAIGIGRKGDRMIHTFRWPLSLVANAKVGRTITKR
jgi:hypothetical protein